MENKVSQNGNGPSETKKVSGSLTWTPIEVRGMRVEVSDISATIAKYKDDERADAASEATGSVP